VGTQNGLSRFDGSGFDVFRFNPSDSNTLSNNWIYSISEDKEGNLWIGTKHGLNKYNRETKQFERQIYEIGFKEDITKYSYDNTILKNRNLLVNTPPVISIYDFETNECSHYQSKISYDAAVKDIRIPVLEDNNGNVWVGNTNGLAYFSLKTKEFTYYPFFDSAAHVFNEAYVTALFKDRNGDIWVGASSRLFRLNKNTNRFEEVNFELLSGRYFSFKVGIRSIVEDNTGKLIIGTEGSGLYVISGNPNKKYEIQNYTSENSDLSHNIIQSLIIDKSENLWIGTISGISKTDLKQKKFRLYRNSDSPNSIDLLGNVIAGLFKNDDGIIWVGNWGQGLNLVNPETNEVEHFSTQMTGNHYISNDFVHVIFKDSDKNIWLGTRDGIFIYNKPANNFIEWTQYFKNPEFPNFEDTRIYHIIEDQAGNYWIGTSNGLYKINLNNSTVEVFNQQKDGIYKISANLVYSLLEDSDGLIWIATVGGLDVFNPAENSMKHYKKTENELSSNFIISLCEDSLRRIWIGTNSYINVYDKKNNEFSYLDNISGIPGNNVYEILEDKNNDLWFATGNGLCRYNIKNNSIKTFSDEAGLQDAEFNLRAAFASPYGELLFGGMNGFNTFYPDSITGNPYIPNIVFTSFQTTTEGHLEEINLEQTNKIDLNYSIQTFTIEFAALEFTNPQNNNFAYKMEGISDEWINIEKRTSVSFFALPPGEYTFSVKGSNNDGVWNNESKTLQIVIFPPWWRSDYAYLGYMVLLILGIWGYIKLRERRLKLEKIRLEKKVMERTMQVNEQNRMIKAKNEQLNELNRTKDKFFSIIGHDLRNHFNIIIGFSENLLYGKKQMDEEKQHHHIDKIYKSSVQAHDLLGNLLTWARLQRNAIVFNPQKINITDKIRDLLHFHEEAAFKKNILIEVFAKEELLVNADENMLSTIIRNLLANAIKFTGDNGEISIRVKRANGFCEIAVRDSGIGIPKKHTEEIFKIDSNITTRGTNGEKGTGLGLVICKEFVEKHGGKIWVKSELQKGSEFVFTLPLFFMTD